MLELKPSCENCRILLPPSSTQAYICSYECTFCRNCALDLLKNVCPNCGGGFVPRPIRPVNGLLKHPPVNKETYKPTNMVSHAEMALKYKNIPPENR
ncbi:MAG TPA: DUF1272 domain-containing protein [Bacteroidia bacterium]|jgi:hypothetical protein|nr:DUF1272 domain-containing protein [Bacteroidia bacterium]